MGAQSSMISTFQVLIRRMWYPWTKCFPIVQVWIRWTCPISMRRVWIITAYTLCSLVAVLLSFSMCPTSRLIGPKCSWMLCSRDAVAFKRLIFPASTLVWQILLPICLTDAPRFGLSMSAIFSDSKMEFQVQICFATACHWKALSRSNLQRKIRLMRTTSRAISPRRLARMAMRSLEPRAPRSPSTRCLWMTARHTRSTKTATWTTLPTSAR